MNTFSAQMLAILGTAFFFINMSMVVVDGIHSPNLWFYCLGMVGGLGSLVIGVMEYNRLASNKPANRRYSKPLLTL